MAAAALAVAILALLVSGWAAWTAHRAFALERARRHDERAPRIEAEEGDHAAVEGIRLTNRGPVDLSSLQFSIVGDADRRGPVDALLVARGDWRAAGDLARSRWANPASSPCGIPAKPTQRPCACFSSALAVRTAGSSRSKWTSRCRRPGLWAPSARLVRWPLTRVCTPRCAGRFPDR